MERYQKSGTVLFTILVPLTTSDNGNGRKCVPYCTKPYRSVETSHKKDMMSESNVIVHVIKIGLILRGHL